MARYVHLNDRTGAAEQLARAQEPSPDLSVTHPSFRVIGTASKSLPLKDWLGDEHANMFFTLPLQPMLRAEERTVLLQTGCSPSTVDTLLDFADRYRARFTGADSGARSSLHTQKNRKLGTRALMRIARRVAQYPAAADDLHVLLSRAVLAEFLPATEAINLQNILEQTGIKKRTQPVSIHIVIAVADGHLGRENAATGAG